MQFTKLVQSGNLSIINFRTQTDSITHNFKFHFRNMIRNLTEDFDRMTDPIQAPQLSSRLFEEIEVFINAIQGLDLVLHDFEKIIYKYKMNVYKINNEGRAKMDASVSLHPWGYGYSGSTYGDGSMAAY